MNHFRLPLLVAAISILFVACSEDVITQTALPTDQSTKFSGSGNCVLCHQSSGTVNTLSTTGADVSQPTHWRSTMMANSAKDPFWQALVRAEAAQIPELAEVIQDRCTNCHLPMGHEEAHDAGDDSYTLDEGLQDALAMDGVSCTLCHQVQPDNLGTIASFSGGYDISPNRVTYGPYENPVRNPMFNITGYEPLYGAHMNTSEHCATCHTLFTPYVDDDNKIAGEFPEQTPYIEWQHSDYPAEDTNCQTCHMPVSEGNAFAISTLGPVGPRSPYFEHHFVGGNTFVLNMLKTYGDELGVTADAIQFDSTMARALRQLQHSTVQLTANASQTADEVSVDVAVMNQAGHKFPSGFPSRRAWLHVSVLDKNGATVFESGKPDSHGELDLEEDYEPHHDLITDHEQVQIYESMMQDVNGDPTFQLLRGAAYKKDNRLPPRGFSADAMTNDTVGVRGSAASDSDFNMKDGQAGTGGDIVHYKVDVAGKEGPFTVKVEMLYQTINPDFLEHMFEFDVMEINRFEGYYDAADKTPTTIASLEIEARPVGVQGLDAASDLSLGQNYPNPVSRGTTAATTIAYSLRRASRSVTVEVLNTLGQVLKAFDRGEQYAGNHRMELPTEQFTPGMYFYRVRGEGFSETRKMIVTP